MHKELCVNKSNLTFSDLDEESKRYIIMSMIRLENNFLIEVNKFEKYFNKYCIKELL